MRFAALLFAFVLAAPAQTVRWISLPNKDLPVHGLPWCEENEGRLWRLPVRLKGTFRKAVWNLAQSPSGGRIRFKSDSNFLGIRLEYPSEPNMKNMHSFGQTGVDLYVDGVFHSTAIAANDSRPGKIQEHVFFRLKDELRRMREITLYLPLYMPVEVHAIGLETDARLEAPKPFAVLKPVVYYGTSITQGGCASRPGMAYPAILGRILNIDYVNLGFSGNGKGEKEVARAVASINAACYVVDFSQNNRTARDLERVYAPFLREIRERHPSTPILAITPISASRENWGKSELEGMRDVIRSVVAARVASGDTHTEVVEGTSLLGPKRLDGLVDGTHPNDLGFQWMAEGLAPHLRMTLK